MTRTRVWGALGGLALAGAAVWALRLHLAVPLEAGRQTGTAASAGPTFAQPEQQQAYRHAVAQGKRRSVKALEKALASSRAKGEKDSAVVGRLEQLLESERSKLEDVRP